VNLDAAPEIAQLAQPRPPQPRQPHKSLPPPTLGALGRQLQQLTQAPQQWWGKVRFDPARPLRIDVPAQPACEAWLTVIPPGASSDCDCELMTLLAGAADEESITDGGAATTPLHPGRIRVHGQAQLHQLRSGSDGYAISLHLRARQEKA
jgi:hypothetical protein